MISAYWVIASCIVVVLGCSYGALLIIYIKNMQRENIYPVSSRQRIHIV